MLKHVLQYLLIAASFVSIPFVLYFAIAAFADVVDKVGAEKQSAESPASSPCPTPELRTATRRPTATSIPTKAVSADVLDLDEVGSAFWLKRRNYEMYDTVANLRWISDGVDDIETDPVMVLIELGMDGPSIANEYIETPWFNDDLSEDEAWAFLGLTYIDAFGPEGSERVIRLSWVVDGISEDESWTISSLPDIFDESPEAGITLISKPWFRDGISQEESEAVQLLGALSHKTGSASQFISMPFLDSVEESDVLALDSLYQLALLNWTTLSVPGEFENFMPHPAIVAGITDDETRLVTLASDAYEFNPGLTDTLLDTSTVISETRTVSLPLAGEVELMITWTQHGPARSLDLLEESVRFAENYMGEPFLVNMVLLLYADSVEPGFAGHNSSANIIVHPDLNREDGTPEGDEAEFVIMHEVAHYYWHGSSHHWIDEGVAEFLSIHYAEDALGQDIGELLASGFLGDYDCTHIGTLKALEELAGPKADECAYDLGLLFFLDMRQVLGTEEFQRGFRRLYLSGMNTLDPDSPDARSITHVREAFSSSSDEVGEVIKEWYEDD